MNRERAIKKYTRNKWAKIYAIEIEYEQQLRDPELRLFHIFLRIVDWDIKHTETFGSSDISQRDLLHLLPPKKPNERNWSAAKVNSAIQALINKGWLERRPDGRLAVRDYKFYRIKTPKDDIGVRVAEHHIQLTRQGVRVNEQPVQSTEKRGIQEFRDYQLKRRELSNNFKFSVQPAEQQDDIKDT